MPMEILTHNLGMSLVMNTTVYGVIHQMMCGFQVNINTALSQAWMLMAITG